MKSVKLSIRGFIIVINNLNLVKTYYGIKQSLPEEVFTCLKNYCFTKQLY